jgi:RHS repeat-associated protein
VSEVAFAYNLRFPGQYYMAETGLNYNYQRDYDPQVGRYVESDPIGLHGGSFSTYSYGGGNPISDVDPKGEAIEAVVPIVIVGYTCYELYCVKKGIDGCAKKYPKHTDPLSSDYAAFAQCQKTVVTVCATMGAFGQDPIGSAASEAGGHAGESLGGTVTSGSTVHRRTEFLLLALLGAVLVLVAGYTQWASSDATQYVPVTSELTHRLRIHQFVKLLRGTAIRHLMR